ncbi:MAG: hypothetical protein ACLGHP_00465, partial [Vicinamibacteria bacterium]
MSSRPDEFVRRLAAAIRAAELYAPSHPLVQRSAQAWLRASLDLLRHAQPVIVGFLEGEVIVNDVRLPRTNATLTGLIRDMRERDVEKITIGEGVELSDVRAFMEELAPRAGGGALAERLVARGIRRLAIGRIAAETESDEAVGLVAARKVYSEAVGSAEQIWEAAKAGEQPDPNQARGIIDSLSRLVSNDRTSLMALTALKQHDNYTFTHMVNVTSL